MSSDSSREAQRAQRLATRAQLFASGTPPYQDSFIRSCRCATCPEEGPVSVAGRVMLLRDMGKTIFLHLQDETGRRQVMVRQQDVEPKSFRTMKQQLQPGDILGVTGFMMRTRTNELTIQAEQVTLLSKAVLDLPDKMHGVQDTDTRYRARELDLLTHPEVMERFRRRSKLIRAIRGFLDDRHFLEVETPLLQAAASGASAEPFTTHHQASDRTLYLRIAPETYLKRLIVAGYDRVYEIGKNFRNEGIDRSHLPEFTMLEYYVAYWNMWDNVKFIRELLQEVVRETCGTLQVSYQGQFLHFGSNRWQEVDYRELVLKDTGVDVLAYDNPHDLAVTARANGFPLGDIEGASLGTVIDRLYKQASRPKLIQPTVLLYHPAVLLPLARRNNDDPRRADAFQVLVNGWEIVKAYSELTDPVIQRETMREQVAAKEAGDAEAMAIDEPFLEAMERGMPPNSGLGLGIDRLVALLTDQGTLRETILFPLG